MVDDLRYAVRLMVRQKAFTTAALVTLALGIGANAAIFSIVYGVMLRPLPYPDADRLVRVSEEHPGAVAAVRTGMLSNHTYFAWLDAPGALEGLGGFRDHPYTWSDGGAANRIGGADLSPVVFRLLGARPAAGRLLHADDELEDGPEVVVLSWQLWQEQFGGDPSAIGRTMTLDGHRSTIVGVTTPDFYFPDRKARLWKPFRISRGKEGQTGIFSMLGKLRAGVTPHQAAAEGTSRARSVKRPMSADLLFGKGGPVEVRVRPLLDVVTARVRPALLVLAAAVGLVLLIACANVANLLLSRGVVRRRELAVRAAIGAGAARLVRQLLTESGLLAAAGGMLGIALAWALVRILPIVAPPDFPRLADIRLDRVIVAFALLVTFVSGLVSGALPALRAARGRLLPALRDGTGASSGAQTRRLGGVLLAAEAALAVILLVGAGLLVRSFASLMQVDSGYDASNVLVARVYPTGEDISEEQAQTFVHRLVQRLRTTPGVVAAGVGNMLPFMRTIAIANVRLAGVGEDGKPASARALSYVVTPGYAEALGLRLRHGRLFTSADLTAGVQPLIINEHFARGHFSDGRPVVGRRLPTWDDRQLEIVGVVANVLKDGLDAQPQNEVYYVPRQGNSGFRYFMNIAIRTSGDPVRMVPQLRAIVRQLDSTVVLDDVATLASRVSASVSEPRFATTVLVALASLAMMLAAVGLYGVLSYHVAQRRREMGVRAALGASRASILRLVVREALTVVGAGVILGVLGAAWLSRLMEKLLFGVTAHDAVTFAVAPVFLVAIAILAALVPANRAASIDPIEALRGE